jgi:hypothetical protein
MRSSVELLFRIKQLEESQRAANVHSRVDGEYNAPILVCYVKDSSCCPDSKCPDCNNNSKVLLKVDRSIVSDQRKASC